MREREKEREREKKLSTETQTRKRLPCSYLPNSVKKRYRQKKKKKSGTKTSDVTIFMANEMVTSLSASRYRPWTTRDYIYIAAEFVSGLLTLMTNGFVLMVLCRYRSLRTVTNCYIGSLAVADILVGLLVPPLVAISHAGLPRDFYACVIVNSLVGVFVNISILSLVCVCLDRYWAVVHPISRLNVATTGRALLLVAATWTVGILIGLIPLVWHKDPEGFQLCSYERVIDLKYNVYFKLFGLLFPILIAMFYLHASILLAFSRTNVSKKRPVSNKSNDSEGIRMLTAAEMKVFKSLFLIFALFAICWVPLSIINCIQAWTSIHVNKDLLMFTIILSHFNSFVNPVLYATGQPNFRRVLRRYIPGFITKDSEASYPHPQGGTGTAAKALRAEKSVHPDFVETSVMETSQANETSTKMRTTTETKRVSSAADYNPLLENCIGTAATEETRSEFDISCRFTKAESSTLGHLVADLSKEMEPITATSKDLDHSDQIGSATDMQKSSSAEMENTTALTVSPPSSENIKPIIASSSSLTSSKLVDRRLYSVNRHRRKNSVTAMTKSESASEQMGPVVAMTNSQSSNKGMGPVIAMTYTQSSSKEMGSILAMTNSPSSTKEMEPITNDI